MSAVNELDEIWQWYQVASDSLRISRRAALVVEPRPTNLFLPKFEGFYDVPREVVESHLSIAQFNLDNLVVLHIVATFERQLRMHVMNLIDASNLRPDVLRTNVRRQCIADSEFWHYADCLIELFESVNENLRGQAKQLVRFRDWVAHGRRLVEPQPPTNCTPVFALDVVRQFLSQAGL
jgi:hypothetical protein